MDDAGVSRARDPTPGDGGKRGPIEPALARFPGAWVLVLGILLPLGALLGELAAGLSASFYVDPIPTPWHAMVVALVPAAVAFSWWPLAKGRRPAPRLHGWVNGLGFAIAAPYALLFVPALPLAAVGLIVGAGILGLAPFTALAALWVTRRYLWIAARAGGERLCGFVPGALAGALLLLAGEWRAASTHVLMRRALLGDAHPRAAALEHLRRFGDEETLAAAAFGAPAANLSRLFFVLEDPIPAAEARALHFRVTGRGLDEARRPRASAWDVATFDRDRGGARVGAPRAGLVLVSSALDGSVAADAALAYLEWTLELRNDAAVAEEARAELSLPPGAFVSRLTLWIEGEEREAAFAARGEVRGAYESIVGAARDPALVTHSGPDRVLLQCFPVPPKGGEMRVRVGISAPLARIEPARAELALPRFATRNFELAGGLEPLVWIEAERQMASDERGLRASGSDGGPHALRGVLERGRLDAGAPGPRVACARDPAARLAWSPDPRDAQRIVRQSLEPADRRVPEHLVVVVDGSRGGARAPALLAEALPLLPLRLRLSVVASGDGEPRVLLDGGGRDDLGPLGAALDAFAFRGGCDAVAAFERALELCREGERTSLLWIHGALPVRLAPTAALEQHLRRRGAPALVDLPLEPGEDALLGALDPLVGARRLGALATPAVELRELLEDWSGASARLMPRRELVDRGGEEAASGEASSAHLARLWAGERANELARAGERARAIELASAQRLVTTVSGAVVLESRADYEGHGLEPAPADEVPTIPEPETMALLGVAGAVAWLARRRRKRAGVAA